MCGRLSGIGRLHGNRSSGIYARVGIITLDGFRFIMAIYTVQYANLDIKLA